MNKANIVAVVVTYNRKDLLIKCIEALRTQKNCKVDILIVDNASTDGTEDELKVYIDNGSIIYRNTGSNLGGAGGFSYGLKEAVHLGYDYLWIMDDDTIPHENALEELIKAGKKVRGKFGFLSSYAKWKDGTPCEMNVPGVSLKWRESIDDIEDGMIRLDTASFVSFFVSSKVIKKVGLPIKEFFIWADDMEYSLRISKKYPCYFVYNSQVTHEMGSNKATAIWETEENRLERYQYLYRNRYYIAKHGSKSDRIRYWVSIKNTIRDTIKSDSTCKKKCIKIILKSALSGLKFNPKIEYIN